MITPAQVRDTIDWVDRAGVAAQIEPLLRRSNRGRPRQLTVRALLVGVKLAIDEAKTSCLSDVHTVLTRDLRRRDQLELGVRSRTGTTITVHQVRRLFSNVARVLDPTYRAGADINADGEVEAVDRAELLQQILDQLLDATMGTGVTHHGGYALDGTGIWSWGRGKKRTQTSADPDARWGSKTAKAGGQEPYFGYELHALVRLNSTRQDAQLVPALAERIVVVPAATNPVTAVLPALRTLAGESKVREVVADRGYSYKTNWTTELHALGVDPVFDLHTTQYGARGTHDGARIITGVPHCPAAPPGLDTITRPERLADGPELEEFSARIGRREKWAFRKISTADTTGKERYECPARAGKLRCPLVPHSLAKPHTLPTVVGAPADPPTCCTQRTITVPGTVDTKNRQRHYWGSHDWITAFRRRSRVEGWFGNVKSNSTENLTRGAFRVMGLAKTSLMLGIYAAATNLRLLASWQARQPSNEARAEPISPQTERNQPGTTQVADRKRRGPPRNGRTS